MKANYVQNPKIHTSIVSVLSCDFSKLRFRQTSKVQVSHEHHHFGAEIGAHLSFSMILCED